MATAAAAPVPEMCSGGAPVLTRQWSRITPGSGFGATSEILGKWRLPLSPDRLDLMTSATIVATLERANLTSDWQIIYELSFPDPLPYGIPYNYEQLVLRWDVPTDPQHPSGYAEVVVDYTTGCSQPGLALFPGQKTSTQTILLGTKGVGTFKNLRLYLTGSRN